MRIIGISRFIALAYGLLACSLCLGQFQAAARYTYEDVPYTIFDMVITTENVHRLSLVESSTSVSIDGLITPSKATINIATTTFLGNCQFMGNYAKNGKVLAPVNTKTKGDENFYIQPNGALLLTRTDAYVVQTSLINTVKDVQNGFQCGPMLVLASKVSPGINPNSTNVKNRSGVGIYSDANGVRHLLFAVSREPVTFFTLSRFFSEGFHCEVALALTSINCAISLPYQQADANRGSITACGYLQFSIPD